MLLTLSLAGCDEILGSTSGVEVYLHGPAYAYAEDNPDGRGIRCVYNLSYVVETHGRNDFRFDEVRWAAMRVHVRDMATGKLLNTIPYTSEEFVSLIGWDSYTSWGYDQTFIMNVEHVESPFKWSIEVTYYDPLLGKTRESTFSSKCLDPINTPPIS